MSGKEFDLTRRKVLGGLGAVGVGAAVGGAGSMALFNDQDDVTGNTMTAGQLDLHVDYTAKNDGTAQTVERAGNGDLAGFTLGDIKPGDDGWIEICLEPVSNPAWIWMRGELTENAENGMTEPEADVDDTPDEGELAQYVDAKLKYESNGPVIAQGTLAEILEAIGDGVLLDYDPSTSDADPFPENNRSCVVIDWWVDREVGNVIQTDRTKFDLSFYAEQRRHNDDPSNPFDGT